MPLPEIVEKVEVPDGVEVSIAPPAKIRVKGKLGELEQDLTHMGIKLELDGKDVVIRFRGKGRVAKSMMGTAKSMIRNMIIGVTKGFTYKLKIIASHFPMNVKVQGDTIIIENFIGERWPRYAKIVGPKTKVIVKGEDVIVTGIDRQAVGQTAANLELATKIKQKDLRKFLDGIYIYEKKIGIEE
ncbi:MAG: 50S ribosomal protein L6 [Thaumarchaeota archaeon]|nr:50S ribosomal protein L6 [Nitrososphaerota archaeon]